MYPWFRDPVFASAIDQNGLVVFVEYANLGPDILGGLGEDKGAFKG